MSYIIYYWKSNTDIAIVQLNFCRKILFKDLYKTEQDLFGQLFGNILREKFGTDYCDGVNDF